MIRRDSLKLLLGIGAGLLVAPSTILGVDKPVIYLTIDDGPGIGMEKMLKDLKRYEAKATFFVVGKQIRGEGRDLCMEALKDGHKLGNHTYSHLNCDRASLEQCCEEILKTDDILGEVHSSAGKVFGEKAFRFPYGRMGGGKKGALLRFLKDHKYTSYYWDVDSWDWRMESKTPLSPEQVLRNAYRAKDGDILLIHDRIKTANLIVPKVLEHFTSKGYVFETL